jgi:hypothetical protein
MGGNDRFQLEISKIKTISFIQVYGAVNSILHPDQEMQYKE